MGVDRGAERRSEILGLLRCGGSRGAVSSAAGGSGTAAGCQRTSHQNGHGGAHHALVFHFDFPPSISGALSRVPLSLSLSYTFFHNLRMDASDLFLEQIRHFTETGLLLLTKSDPFKGMCPGWNRFYGKIMLLSVRDVFWCVYMVFSLANKNARENAWTQEYSA